MRQRVLGMAFLLQFVTSLTAGVIYHAVLAVPGKPEETVLRIAAHPGLLRATVLLEMSTAVGIIWLGILLFSTLRSCGETAARLGLALYVLEAALLAVSRIPASGLLAITRDFGGLGGAPTVLPQAAFALASADSANVLAMFSFCAGAFVFYWLLFKSKVIPRALSLWGLLALVPVSAATVLAIAGISVPFYLYIPYVPFELVVGLWILIAGLRNSPEPQMS